MKKFLALVLTLLMLISLAACGESKRSSKKESSNKTTTTSATETQTEPEPSQVVDPVTDPATPSADSITFGRLTNTSYESDTFGFGVEVPSSWTTKSASEIAAMNSTDENTLKNDFESILTNKQTAFTFYSVDNSTGNNLNIAVENLAMSNNSGMNGEEYLEIVKSSLETYYEALGATDVEIEISSFSLGSKTYDYLEAVYEMNGVSMDQVQIAISSEDYMCVITFTVTDIESFGYLDDYFYTL